MNGFRFQVVLIVGLLSTFQWLSLQRSSAVAQSPSVVDVEWQPLASNVKRMQSALESLGYPLAADQRDEIVAAIEDQDSSQIQRAVDKLVLAVVTISPEERVSVQRGPADGRLQQSGYRPLLVKIVNQSTSTGRLRVNSPQAGPLYAGTAQLSMQRQQQLWLLQNQNIHRARDRFLDIAVHRDRPMMPTLSGLEVEYVILLAAASDAGKREAILQFDLGEGTADLEHRNELPVLFQIDRAIPVRLSVRDDDGTPGIARLEFRDSVGRVYPPQAKRLSPDFFFQPQIYRNDGEIVLLPPGEFDLEYSRGPEYHVVKQRIEVPPVGQHELNVSLKRWFNANEHGFFSGDHHIHAAGCAHYTFPTEGVTPEAMFRQVRGEGLNVGCVLTWGPCFEHQRQFFGAEPMRFGTTDTMLKYDLEISGFGSQALGHVCLLNLKDQTYPGSDGTKTKGWPTWTTPVMRWAKSQGGYAGYAHSASGLAIDPDAASERLMTRYDGDADGTLTAADLTDALLPEPFHRLDRDRDRHITMEELVAGHERAAERLPNLAIPEMNGVGAMEICVSTVAGVCDFISAMDTRRIQEWNTWYHLLNCGFPLKVSGETDFPCMSSRRVGKGRVYVRLGSDMPLDFQSWCQGLAEGRSYVSDGYAHVPRFEVQGVAPGEGQVELRDAGSVDAIVDVAFAPQTPIAVAYGTRTGPQGRAVTGDTVTLHGPRDDRWVTGGERIVEIVVNGMVVGQQTVPADGQIHRLVFNVPIERSSWVAVRQFPQLHSNPVNVIVAGAPIRASRNSARWCIEMTKLLWQNRHSRISPAERPAAKQAFDHALDVLREIAASSYQDNAIDG